jgi:hypothetical protein
VGKAYRTGFWWPTAVTDAEDLVSRCQNCQFFGKQTHVTAHSLITIPPSWPFACWSLDMIGPFTTAPGGFTHVLVAIDKFTKWIEYKPIVTVCVFVILDLYFDSVKCMLVSVKLLCICVKFLKILSKEGIFVIMEKLGLFLSNVN